MKNNAIRKSVSETLSPDEKTATVEEAATSDPFMAEKLKPNQSMKRPKQLHLWFILQLKREMADWSKLLKMENLQVHFDNL